MENANKGIPIVGRALQRAARQYNRLELMDLSNTKEKKKGAYRNYSKLGHCIQECRNRPRE